MITVNLLEKNWKEKFVQELSKIGLKKCKSNGSLYHTFKHGSRRFVFNDEFTFVDVAKVKPALIANQYERKFDEELFLSYINESNFKKNNQRENINAIKFSQEFFTIRLEGMIRNIHPSVSDVIEFTSTKETMTFKFELYRMNITIKHKSNKKISELVNLDYMEEPWELTIDSYVPLPSKNWYSPNNVLIVTDTLENIILLLSQDSIKELAESNISEMKTLDNMIEENERTIQWYKSENEKFAQDRVKLDIEIAMKMKDTYETFRHRPSENKSRKSIPTGEEGISKT